MKEEQFILFSKKVFIDSFDIESNSSIEKSVFLLISMNSIINPSLLWEMMISKCLSFASQRLIVNYENLFDIYKDYLKLSNEDDTKEQLEYEKLFIPAFENLNIASGKEVLLCKSSQILIEKLGLDKDIDYIIIELYRFDEECNKKVSFRNNQCILSDDETILELVFRASSNKRIESFMLENQEIFFNSSIIVLPAKNIDYVEHSSCVRLYTDKLVEKYKSKKELFKCLECGKAISEDKAIIVEIDEFGRSNDIGIIHKKCLRPTIRVLGWIESELFKDYDISSSFDWQLWIKKVINGQGVFNNQILQNTNKDMKILWNSSVDYTQQYNYCIKEYLEDDSVNYVLRRGQVERFSKKGSEIGALKLNNLLLKKEKENDYLCVTNKERIFGTYNGLKNLIDFDDKLIRIKGYESTKVTQHIINEYKTIDNYYAPLIYMTIGENQDIFSIDNMIVLLSNPLEINKYIENWKFNNIYLEKEFELIIISDDKDFDNFMYKSFNDNLKVIINPQFNHDGILSNFIEVKRLEDIEKNYS